MTHDETGQITVRRLVYYLRRRRIISRALDVATRPRTRKQQRDRLRIYMTQRRSILMYLALPLRSNRRHHSLLRGVTCNIANRRLRISRRLIITATAQISLLTGITWNPYRRRLRLYIRVLRAILSSRHTHLTLAMSHARLARSSHRLILTRRASHLRRHRIYRQPRRIMEYRRRIRLPIPARHRPDGLLNRVVTFEPRPFRVVCVLWYIMVCPHWRLHCLLRDPTRLATCRQARRRESINVGERYRRYTAAVTLHRACLNDDARQQLTHHVTRCHILLAASGPRHRATWRPAQSHSAIHYRLCPARAICCL